MKITKATIAEITLMLFGAFLIVDSLFLHLLAFAYPEQIAFLDAIIDPVSYTHLTLPTTPYV